MPHTWASVQPAVYTLSATTRTVQPGSITNYLSYLRMAPAAFSACVMLVREPKEVRHTAWQLLPQNSSSQSKSFPPAATWRGKSGSGTHDVELIPAMYNSPTAGGQHVHLHSQDSRQASLNHWHLLLVMCHSAHSMGGGSGWWVRLFGQVCLVRWTKYVKMQTVVMSVVDMSFILDLDAIVLGCDDLCDNSTWLKSAVYIQHRYKPHKKWDSKGFGFNHQFWNRGQIWWNAIKPHF